jgi:hypothetical protein
MTEHKKGLANQKQARYLAGLIIPTDILNL